MQRKRNQSLPTLNKEGKFTCHLGLYTEMDQSMKSFSGQKDTEDRLPAWDNYTPQIGMIHVANVDGQEHSLGRRINLVGYLRPENVSDEEMKEKGYQIAENKGREWLVKKLKTGNIARVPDFEATERAINYAFNLVEAITGKSIDEMPNIDEESLKKQEAARAAGKEVKNSLSQQIMGIIQPILDEAIKDKNPYQLTIKEESYNGKADLVITSFASMNTEKAQEEEVEETQEEEDQEATVEEFDDEM